MTWCWLSVATDEPPRDALRVVPVRDVGGAARGHLVLAASTAERPRGGLRVDARVLGDGPATWLSLCRSPNEASLPFDDPMVAGALRRRLAGSWPTFVSTLLVDWSRIGGAIAGGVDRASVQADPFARVFPQQLLRVDAGRLGVIAAPTGPGITRYGSGNPWPWDRYAGQVG